MKNSQSSWTGQLRVVSKTYTSRWHFWGVLVFVGLTIIPMLLTVDSPQSASIVLPREIYSVRHAMPSTWNGDGVNEVLTDSESFQIPPQVKTVSFSGQMVNDTTLERIVSSSPQITGLYLHQTAVTDHGLSLLSRLPNLSSLFVFGSLATGSGLESFAMSKSLKSLTFSKTHLSHDGVMAIAALDSVVSLDLSLCDVPEAELIEIGKMQQLRSLHLSGANITPASVAWIGRLRQLQGINIERTNLTSDAVRQLKRALPQLVEIRGVSTLVDPGAAAEQALQEVRKLRGWRVAMLAPLLNASMFAGCWLGIHLKQQFAAPRSRMTPHFAAAHLAFPAILIPALGAVPAGIIWFRTGTSIVSLMGIEFGLLAVFLWATIRNSLATLLVSGAALVWTVLWAGSAIQSQLAEWFLSSSVNLPACLLLAATTTSLGLIGYRLATMHEAMPEFGLVDSFDLAFDLTSRSTNRTRQQFEARAISKSVVNAWLMDRQFEFVMRHLPAAWRSRHTLLMQLSHGFALLLALPTVALMFWVMCFLVPGFGGPFAVQARPLGAVAVILIPMMCLSIVNGQWLQHWRWLSSEVLRPVTRGQYVRVLLTAMAVDGVLVALMPIVLVLIGALRGWSLPEMSTAESLACCVAGIVANTTLGISLVMWLSTWRRTLPPIMALSVMLGTMIGLSDLTLWVSPETRLWLLPALLAVVLTISAGIVKLAVRRWNAIELA